MKKLKIFLFIFVLFLTPCVFAQDVTNSIQYNTDNPTGTYKGDEIDLGGYNGKFDVKTSYNGKLSFIEFVLSSTAFDFNANTTYTITLNMSGNNWRNNFMSPQVIKLNSNGSQQTTNGSLSVSNFQFVSRKSIKFNFRTNNTISPYLLFRLYSTDYASTNNIPITGDSNWNLNLVTITTSASSSGSGSSSSGSSSTGGSSTSGNTITCNNGTTLSSSIYGNAEITKNTHYLNSSGAEVSNNSYGIVYFIPVTPHTTYYINKSNNTDTSQSYCLSTNSPQNLSNVSWTTCSTYNSRSSISFDTGNATYLSLSIKAGETVTVSSCVSSVDVNNQNTQNIINNNNSNTTNIIENNNDNTQEIVDNQNKNTQDIINNQNEIANKCYPPHSEQPEFVKIGLNTTGSYYINNANAGGVLDVSKYQGKYINIKFNSLPQNSNSRANYCFGQYKVAEGNQSCLSYNISSANVYSKTYNNVLVPENANYLYLVGIVVRSDFTDWVNGVSIELPEHCVNRQDEINNSIKDTNNYLMDDSDPSIDDSTLNNVFGQVHFTDPLSYLLTLPTQLINKIVSLSDTCSSIDLGTLYGVHLTLPCINLENILGSDLWGVLDVILSVGLLAVILKNFYDTISNLLTLGGEKEAKEKFSMPTPMDFLAMILGGDNR